MLCLQIFRFAGNFFLSFSNLYLEYATYGLLFLVLISLTVIIAYRKIGNPEVTIVLGILLSTVLSLTIIPGYAISQAYITFLLGLFFFGYAALNFNIPDFLRFNFLHTNFNILLSSLFLIFCTVSLLIFNTKDFISPSGLAKALSIVLGLFFYCYFLPRTYFGNTQIYNLFIKALLLFGALTSFLGIMFYFLNINVTVAFGVAASSYFRHPNSVAFVYTFTYPVALYLLLFKRKELSGFQMILLITIIPIIFGALILTVSRAGFVSIIVSTIVLVLFYNRKFMILSVGVIAVLILLSIELVFSVKGLGSFFSRFGLIYAALEMLKSSTTGFLWGFGPVSVFQAYTEFKYQLGPLFEDIAYPHNFLLFFIMQFGFLSFLAAFIFYSRTLYKSIRLLFSNSKEHDILLLPVAICSGVFFQSLLEDTILFPEYFVFHLYFIFFGFIVYYLKVFNKVTESPHNFKEA